MATRARALAVVLMVIVGVMAVAAPAYAGTLSAVAWTPTTTSTGARNVDYQWDFTTASSATLSRVTAGVPAGTSGMSPYFTSNGVNGNYASTPDSAANSVTNDLDLRVKVQMPNWTPSAVRTFIAKRGNSGSRSYGLGLAANNQLELMWDTNGSNQNFERYTLPALANGATKWLRATLQRNNGGTYLATFYTSDDGSSWTTLGSNAGGSTTTVYDSTAPLEVGSYVTGTSGVINGEKIYYAEVRNGINGTKAAVFDPTEAWSSLSSWTASTGETWTINRTASTLPADIVSDLSVVTTTGIPSTGTATVRAIDQLVTYSFSATAIGATVPLSMTLHGLVNTATAGTYTSLITTKDNAGTPATVDTATTAGVVFARVGADDDVSVIVDPALTFTVSAHAGACNGATQSASQVTSSLVNFGRANASSQRVGAQDLDVVTNASHGFSIYLSASGPMTSGSGRTLASFAGTNASPSAFPILGSEGFGYTTSDAGLSAAPADRFTNGGPWWAASTSSGQVSYAATGGAAADSVCVAYKVGVAGSTTAGTYSSTITYTVVPTF